MVSISKSMKGQKLQGGFSQRHGRAVFDQGARRLKARKALAILGDFLPSLHTLEVLEIGCAAGYGTAAYAELFRSVNAIDIDEPAVMHAGKNNCASNISYFVMDSQHTAFADETFDAVICSHVYEHVASAKRLLAEIYRVLRPNGVCFFAAGNRLSLIEPHYRLPLLSVVPKLVAHGYLRVLKRGQFYQENHLSYWSLRRLVSDFQLYDYTQRVTEDPVRFDATDVLAPGSLKQGAALILLRLVYWACPTYLWLLRKPA